jgi:hypothetical protein
MVGGTEIMSKKPDARGNAPGNADEISDEIAALATLIAQARELVKSDHTIDLAALSGKVGAFCAGLSAHPPADAESVARMIEALVADLNSLAEEISAQHAKLTGGGKGNGG